MLTIENIVATINRVAVKKKEIAQNDYKVAKISRQQVTTEVFLNNLKPLIEILIEKSKTR